MKGSAKCGHVLGLLGRLCWTVTRVHETPRGSLIVTAVRQGRIASAELPERAAEEPSVAWLARLEHALCENAYDPAASEPPLVVLPVSEELAELVPSDALLRGGSE